jgi:cysteine desulfurase
VDWESLDLDAITFSTHKVGGPQGVGGYVAKPTLPFKVPFRGGGQERSYRPGTENMIGLMGLGALISMLNPKEWTPIAQLRDLMESEIAQLCPEVCFFSQSVSRLPNTSNFTMPGVKSETQVMAFDLRGMAVSAGSACSSGKVKESRILQAMGVPKGQLQTALRVSLGWNTTEADILTFIKAWGEIYKQARKEEAA